MKKIIIFIILTSLTFQNCSDKTEGIESQEESKVVHIAKKMKKDFSFVKEVRFVFLDNAIPIGRIGELIVTEKNIILWDQTTEAVNIYDHQGKFLHMIRAKGKGPGEYIRIKDVAYKPDADQIAVLDSRKILLYSLNGSFRKVYKFKILPDKLTCDSKYYYLYNPLSSIYPSQYQAMQYSLFVLDNKGHQVAKYFPNDDHFGKISLINEGFYHCSGNIYLNRKLRHAIYSIQDGHVCNKIIFDFEDNENFENFIRSNVKGRMPVELITRSGYAFGLNNLCVSDNFIYFSYIRNRDKIHVVIQRSTNEVIFHSNQQQRLSNVLVENGILIFRFPEYCYSNEFITILPPSYIREIYHNKKFKIEGKGKWKNLIEKFKKLDLMDNPVIGFYQFESNHP